MRTICQITILLVFMSGCGVKQTKLYHDDFSLKECDSYIIKSITYDKYYLPVFGKKSIRPKHVNDTFHLIFIKDNKVIKSFNIQLDENNQTIDYTKPLVVSSEWTEKGFKLGLKMASEVRQNSGGADPRGVISVQLVCLVLSGPIGLISGLGKGTFDLSKDIYNGILINRKEILLGYNDYFYDSDGKLVKIKIIVPYKSLDNKPIQVYDSYGNKTAAISKSNDEPIELIELQYYYKEKTNVPYKTVIIENYPDKKIKILELN